MMWRSAAMKFPCSRPASYQEYMDGRILGMPETNVSGCEIIFTGNPSRGDAPAKHKGWVLGGYPKRAVLKGDPLDGDRQLVRQEGDRLRDAAASFGSTAEPAHPGRVPVRPLAGEVTARHESRSDSAREGLRRQDA